MALSAGTKIGPYEVIGLIGQGGMGEVWQARDTKLDRNVALKVLPEAFTSDPDRLARFEREAKILASLNHPNIGSIYGLEEAEGVKALVLELVEGPTLADRITQGAIPIDEALPIAKQIAEALEAAHEQGVIHRDLKPANVKVKDDGTVKVLDFGLAKAFQPDASDPSLSQSPTISLTAAATQMGMVLGTAAYMAPEQARGKPVDKRADVWAFGCVLFEMLTSRRVFEASDVSEVLALVLVKDPDLTSVPTDVPEAVRALLGRCLTKNPKDRLRDIGEARVALRDASLTAPAPATGSAPSIAAEPSAAAQPQGAPADRRSLALAIAASVIVTAVVTGFAVWSLRPSNPREVSRFTYEIPPETPLRVRNRNVVAASPDGRQFVYNTAEGLHLRSLEQLESRLLPGTEATLGAPFFSPDGQSVGFSQQSQLKRVSLSGGAPVAIAEYSSPPASASWAADGTIFFADNEGIKRVPAAGGTPVLVVAAAEGEVFDAPHLLPDGDTVLFSVAAGGRGIAQRWDNATVTAQSLSSGERVDLIEGGGDARYILTGHLVYALDDGLFAVAFDLDSLNVLGGPVSLVEGVARASGNLVSSANYAVADNGTLFYLSGGGEANSPLVWVDRNGAVDVLDTVPPNVYESPRLSPDDQRLLVVADGDAWIYDLASGRESRVTSDGLTMNYAGWTPSGTEVAYTASGPDGGTNLWMGLADGSEAPRQLTTLDGLVHFDSVSPDGRTIAAHHHGSGQGQSDLLRVSLDTPDAEPETWFGRDFANSDTVFSPDGRYVAHSSSRTGQREIFIQPFPGPGAQTPASVGGGTEPAWARNGELFYWRPSDYAMMAVTVSTEPTLTVGQPRMLFPGSTDPGGSPRARYAVTSDGERFLMSARWLGTDDGGEGPQVNIILNWTQELLERVPVP